MLIIALVYKRRGRHLQIFYVLYITHAFEHSLSLSWSSIRNLTNIEKYRNRSWRLNHATRGG